MLPALFDLFLGLADPRFTPSTTKIFFFSRCANFAMEETGDEQKLGEGAARRKEKVEIKKEKKKIGTARAKNGKKIGGPSAMQPGGHSGLDSGVSGSISRFGDRSSPGSIPAKLTVVRTRTRPLWACTTRVAHSCHYGTPFA